jgi:oligoribonuclease NrnB/cAMP/cGMP phosphodiesterase (DHH superfamily)
VVLATSLINIANTIEANIIKSNRQGTIIRDLSADNAEEASVIKTAGTKARTRGWNFIWIDHHTWRPGIKDLIHSFATVMLSKEK